MFKVLDAVKALENTGRSIIHLEIGDPDFQTPKNVVDAAVMALEKGETHYVSSWGVDEFVCAIQDATAASRGFRPAQRQILVTPGANISIFYSVFCLANPGREVLVPDPGFPTYLSVVKMCGAVAVPYPLSDKDEFRIRAANIERLITPNTRLLILNSPQNPTGAVTESWALREVFELAKARDIYVLSDEIYARMIYGNDAFFSIASLDQCRERVILTNGFSKAFAMTGWRLGALIGPDVVMERMMLLLQTTSSCVAPFLQAAGTEALRGDQAAVRNMMSEYQARRNILVDGLNRIPGIQCHWPGGAFYAFPRISDFGLSSQDFCNFILEDAGVAILPGSCFGLEGEGFVRLCYANSRDNIREALVRIERSCARLARKSQ